MSCSVASISPRREQERSSAVEHARAFVARWRTAAPALEEDRRQCLQALDATAAREAARDLARLWTASGQPNLTSGLVEQQRVFHALERRTRRRKR